jgi:TonB family protein
VDEFLKGTVAQDMPGLTQPVLTKEVKPKYTPDAMRAKIQGRVKIQMVVATDGTVDRARVVESLDAATGLDAAALAAAKQYVFTPAKLRDRVVPVAVDVYLEFRLH